MKRMLIIGAILVSICASAVGLYVVLRQPEPEFKGFIPAEMPEMTYDEIISYPLYYVAEVEILRKLNNKEKFDVVKNDTLAESYTLFEAKIIYDYLTKEKGNENIFLSQFGNDEWQLRGDPIFKVGDKYLMILGKNNPSTEYYAAYGGPNSVFDIEEKNGEKFIYKRFGSFSELDDISIEMDDVEKKAYRNGKENLLNYMQKFRLDEFCKRIKEDYEMRGYKK